MSKQQQQQNRPVLWRTQPKVISPRTSALKRPPMMLKKPASSPTLPQVSSENMSRSSDFESSPKALDFFTNDVKLSRNEAEANLPSSRATAIAEESTKKCSHSSSSASSPQAKQPKKKAATTCSPSQNVETVVPVLKKPPSPQELQAQRKAKIAHYGRKQGSPKAVPEEPLLSRAPTKKRCGWITSQSDAVHIAYHDQEWGVPVHDDKLLFELLTLGSAQSEQSWCAILSKREQYRTAFAGFDPAIVSSFNSERISAIRSSIDILQQDGKVQCVVENAQRVLQIVQEFGSFDKYMWSFFNYKPIVTSFRMSSQVPVKSSRSELISKDLIRRGFRGVAPAIIYSFMQAAGMTNDHTLQCFRHEEVQHSGLSQSRYGFGGDYGQKHDEFDTQNQVYVSVF